MHTHPYLLHALGRFLLPLLLWSIFWKGLALWHSARRGQAWWFVILIVVNTVGILEMIYLFAVAGLKPSELFSKKV
jgi:Family of unknown function (DUF5652)